MVDCEVSSGFYYLKCFHGSTVYAEPDGRLVHAFEPPTSGGGVAWLYVPQSKAQVAFLISDDDLRVEGDNWRSTQTLGFALEGMAGGVALRHPSTGRYLCAHLPEVGAFNEILTIDRLEAGNWEQFSPIPGKPLSPNLVQLAGVLQNFVDRIESVGLTVGCFSEWPPALVRAVAEACLADSRDAVAVSLLNNPNLADAMGTGADPWLATALPKLSRWVASGRPVSRIINAGPEWDFLAQAGEHGVIQCFGQLLNHRARRSIAPSRGACIIATARNEGIYLIEWLAYHRALGFEHFFITSNDNTDESDALLAALAAAGVITWTRSRLERQVRPQCKAYSFALQIQ